MGGGLCAAWRAVASSVSCGEGGREGGAATGAGACGGGGNATGRGIGTARQRLGRPAPRRLQGRRGRRLQSYYTVVGRAGARASCSAALSSGSSDSAVVSSTVDSSTSCAAEERGPSAGQPNGVEEASRESRHVATRRELRARRRRVRASTIVYALGEGAERGACGAPRALLAGDRGRSTGDRARSRLPERRLVERALEAGDRGRLAAERRDHRALPRGGRSGGDRGRG